jgi:hypothetical protein
VIVRCRAGEEGGYVLVGQVLGRGRGHRPAFDEAEDISQRRLALAVPVEQSLAAELVILLLQKAEEADRVWA